MPEVVPKYAQDVDFLAGSRWMPASMGSVGRMVTSDAVSAAAARIALPVAGLPVAAQWEVVAASCELADRHASGESPADALDWVRRTFGGVLVHGEAFRAMVVAVSEAGLFGSTRDQLGRAALCRAAEAMTSNID